MTKEEEQQNNSTYVYVRSEDHAWVPAIQLSVRKKHATVVRPLFKTEQQMLQCGSRSSQKYSREEEDVLLADYPNGVLPMQNVDANGNLEDFKDMVALPFMHEAALLYNLKRRHVSEKPYTRTGDIVIAVNPYQWFTDLYTEKKRIYYSNRLVWDRTEEDPRINMEPHVYEVSALSYKGLAAVGEDQSILVSGESGAGKTETVKICLNHIASTQRGPVLFGGGTADAAENNDPIVQRIVDSNPLLEAFGNAKTRRNDNSSRFGKYLQLQFDNRRKGGIDATSRCGLVGSKCEVYLLEKNRVVKHEPEERTFHIFYQLLASSDRTKARFWHKLAGTDSSSFSYVGHSSCNTIEGVHDADKFDETVQALGLVNVKGDRLDMLMKAICVVLQLGNLGFQADALDSDKSIVSTPYELEDLGALMEVTEDDLMDAFTQRTFATKTESHKVPLNAEAAKDACDALAKEIYQKIFLWLVNTINQATTAAQHEEEERLGLIGLLDIFGFEAFKVNRFEQLCINYANEKLQQKFTEDVFRSVQQEYEAEGIPLKDIYYDDNTDVLDLIEGRTGLLAMLNEECIRPKGSDFDFVQKALKANKNSKCLVVHRTDRMSFGIHHYAGGVMYDAEFFVSRNQDTLPTDLQQCAEKCSNDIVRSERSEPAIKKKGEATAEEDFSKRSRLERDSRVVRKESNIAAPSVWTKYKNQLSNLMSMLRKTRSRYIRCIKPNNQKAPLIMEHAPVIEQLRCAGVVAGITITRSVFPNSLENSVVLARYSSLWDPDYPSKKTSSMSIPEQRARDCKALMKGALKTKRTQRDDGSVVDSFVVGKTKTYFRAGALEWLEMNRLSDMDTHAIVIQKAARGWLARQRGQSSRRKRWMEEAEQERIHQEELNRQEERRQQRLARKREHKAKTAVIRDRMIELQKQLHTSDETTKNEVRALKERAQSARRENEAFEDMLRERNVMKERMDAEAKLAEHKMKLAENAKLIDYLKKENKKIRKSKEKAQSKYDVHKDNNDKLHDSNSNMGDVFDEMNADTQAINDRMEDSTFILNKAKKQNKSLRAEVLKMQDVYMGQAEARLEYQKTMARLLQLIQDRCKDRDLTEETVVIALNCEAEAKAIMAALEMECEPYMVASDVSENSESSHY